eukprot:GILK01009396.1.p1 GENE.GILK01009396.1~~GILK01009396.1.p1  ORF type:complete len:269 (+),score=41.58 GILK01009396.1:35-808(+)
MNVQDRPATVADYLANTYQFESRAVVLEVSATNTDDGVKTILLDRTIFHPQGGGQPSDTGYIRSADGSTVFAVESLKAEKSGHIFHIGKFIEGETFTPEQEVCLQIDRQLRETYARLHSAGHLLDVAMTRCGFSLKPGKGCHFPEGAYVEYIGSIQDPDKDAVIQRLQAECNALIQAGSSVAVQTVSHAEAGSILPEVPDYLPVDRPVRIVSLISDDPAGVCPCGGTHVQDVKQIDRIRITKIQKKGKNTRISYSLE